ncbi:hypothetical protein Goe25_00430 [Bacillus phage vB_BsuM-Goe25]|nr:hypothetical protein BSP14_039 [Bacillus phage BSP14]AYJ76224.1 hypothetical protein BSP12_038 [Bacillus phage BSP12]UJJ74844.1 hypothetical protein [Bacillus phage BM-P1]WCS68909.1 hypothetical protein Goe17_00450 [Bacillus phage vB_BsuM-Goe17]WCS69165.1 hypothetical protein Goe20_00430 [Bacillus phage vB_BsuM-Goe20]WCS69676.1 hypothetical protein Goe25_00430 [Bacillus phage vB_BsuM-Goe25]
MSEERKSLLNELRETFVIFKGRNSVGRMKTEHSIFIPSSYLQEKSGETEEFIRAAKEINKQSEWACPVEAVPLTTANVKGVEFVFTFSPSTNFDAIISEIDSRLL